MFVNYSKILFRLPSKGSSSISRAVFRWGLEYVLKIEKACKQLIVFSKLKKCVHMLRELTSTKIVCQGAHSREGLPTLAAVASGRRQRRRRRLVFFEGGEGGASSQLGAKNRTVLSYA